jgi:hypothetical protein
VFKDSGAASKRVSLRVASVDREFHEGLERGTALAESANFCRTLSQSPPNIATTGFMAQQVRNNPEIRNLWSKGSTWGFMWARLAGDTLELQVFTTPADLSGRPVFEAQFAFPRRAAQRPASKP